jgi:hypothetical protein
MSRRQRNEPIAATEEKQIRADHERACFQTLQHFEGWIEIVLRAGMQEIEL